MKVFEKTGGEYLQTAHFSPFKEYATTRGGSSGGYDIYKADITSEMFHCEAGGRGSGFLKTAKVDYIEDGGDMTVTIDTEPLDVSKRADNGFRQDDVYFNVNDAQHLVLKKGETFRLIPIRVWQAMEGITQNYFIEPDYHVEVLGNTGAVSAEWAGEPGLEYEKITAVGTGVAVLRVTYDPIFIAGKENRYFNAIEPRNTGVIIVSVVEDGSHNPANIETNIDQREYDTVYFDKAKADHAEYSFKPSANSEAGEISVRVHRPIHAGGAEWGASWSTSVKNPDGFFTVNLYDGRNIVEVGAIGSDFREYHVINAKGIGISAKNLTNAGWKPGSPLKAGDSVEIAFDGIKTPLEKIAAIYNPGFTGTCYVSYKADGGEEVRGSGVQYDLSQNNKVLVTAPVSGVVKLTNGVIFCDHMGDELDSHRTRPGNELIYPNFEAENVKGVYSTMPDLVFGSGADDNGVGGGNVNNSGGSSSGGGGGCDAGAFGIFALAALAFAITRRKA
ncbi:MAG: hypothetical protein LBS75_00070 [Synergistaceae bacterium]|nr:hypothetical protein [Synergistaceae bacterium]